MYLLSNGHNYIGLDLSNAPTVVASIKKALSFNNRQKAVNYKENLKTSLKRFGWEIVEIYDSRDTIQRNVKIKENKYSETGLEKEEFNIVDFFKNTINTISQLKSYALNMDFLEKEYNKKILDVRHYKRDIRTKLNAIQLQRLEQFEIQLERERYECKSNRVIVEMFLDDLNRLEDPAYIKKVKDVKESEYKPEILSYELLDEIVGKKREKSTR